MKKILILCVAILALPSLAWGEEQSSNKVGGTQAAQTTVTKSAESPKIDSIVMPDGTKRAKLSLADKRQLRGISNMRTSFVAKKQWIVGGSVSYSAHSNDNYSFLIVEDIKSKGYSVKVTPMIGYAYAKNAMVGIRFGYSRALTNLDAASLSITSLDNAFYYSLKHTYDAELMWRRYIPLGDRNKRFALFAEVDLAFGGSQAKFAAGQPLSGTYARSFNIGLGVNPGVAAFLTNNFALEVNVGVFGFNYSKTRQVHNQVTVGDISGSQFNFKVNIFSIGLGASFYL